MADMSIDFGILAGAGAPVREFKAGEVIFKQGDPASEFYVIQSGKVDIRLGNRLLGTLSDHDIFGEMALIDAAPRHRDCGNRRQDRPGRREAVFVSGQPHAAFRAQRHAGSGAAPARAEQRGLGHRQWPVAEPGPHRFSVPWACRKFAVALGAKLFLLNPNHPLSFRTMSPRHFPGGWSMVFKMRCIGSVALLITWPEGDRQWNKCLGTSA
jgi:hypothetical protein